jgi:hypothetical protein
VGSLKPVFDWQDVPGATGYTLQVSRNNSFTLIVLTANSVPSTLTPTVNLPAGTQLFWRVKATGLNGPSAWSSLTGWSFTTP